MTSSNTMPCSEPINMTTNQQTPTKEHQHIYPHLPNGHNILHFIDEYAHHLAFINQKAFYPRFDVEEDETAYELFGELPGCKKEDIRIHEVDGFGIQMEGSSSRLPPQTSNVNAEHINVEPTNSHTTTKPKVNGNVEMKAGEKTTWLDMAEPGMEAAFGAEGGAEIAEGNGSETSNLTKVEKHNLRFTKAKTSVNPQLWGTMQEPPPTYPRTLFHERLVGNFQRIIRFPGPVDTKQISAELKNGILRLRVAKDLRKEAELAKEKRRVEVAWADAHIWGL